MTAVLNFRPYCPKDSLSLQKFYTSMPKLPGVTPPRMYNDIVEVDYRQFWEGGALLLGQLERVVIGIGALSRLPKEDDPYGGEIKHIRVLPRYMEFEGVILSGLETWASALGVKTLYLDLSAWAGILQNPENAEGYIRANTPIPGKNVGTCYKKYLK